MENAIKLKGFILIITIIKYTYILYYYFKTVGLLDFVFIQSV